MTDQILLKYAARRTPRYTSYPTAPQFGTDIDPVTYAQWLRALPAEKPVSLYLHVPFCKAMCWYCGCHTKATRRIEPVAAYAQTLLREIDLIADIVPARLKVSHVHWGGGSPSYLPGDELRRLMDRLRSRFDVLDTAEIAMEIDPRLLSDDFTAAMGETGFTRASFGVQTFDTDVQNAINRPQPFPVVAEATARIREAGIAGLNFDLLYGLPGQTEENCRRTAEQALSLSPDRFSVFGYAHVPHLKTHQRLIPEASLAGTQARLRQAEAMAAVLIGAGYAPIGFDHFAKPDDALTRAQAEGKLRRNFQGYTDDTATTLIGLGASSISELPQGYVQNIAATHEWDRQVNAGAVTAARGYRLIPEDRMRREIIARLMCHFEVDTGEIAARHGLAAPAPDLAELEADGVVSSYSGVVIVNPQYRTLVRHAAAAFDAHLPASTAVHSVSV